jgi:hypothetical protein
MRDIGDLYFPRTAAQVLTEHHGWNTRKLGDERVVLITPMAADSGFF